MMEPRLTATIGHAPDDFIKNKGISKNEIAIFYACLGLLVAINLLGFVAFLRPALSGHADFRAYYSAGYLTRTGHRTEIYDYAVEQAAQNLLISKEQLALPFIHPAYETLLFVPLSLAGYRTAYLVFLGLNICFACASCRFLRRSERTIQKSNWSEVLLLGSFLPVTIALMQGQDSLLLLASLCAAQACFSFESETAAGAFLGLGLFRFQITIPIACLCLLWRKWKVVGGFLASAAAVASLSVWITGVHATNTYLNVLLSVGSGSDTLVPQAVSMMPNLRGLVETLAGGQIGHSFQQELIAALSLGLFFWCALRAKGFASSVIFAVLASYHALPHDLSLLILPISVACARLAKGTSDSGRLELAIVGLLVCAPTVLLFFGSSFYLYAIVLMGALILRPEMFEFMPRLERTATVANAS